MIHEWLKGDPLTRIYERGLATNRSSPAPLRNMPLDLTSKRSILIMLIVAWLVIQFRKWIYTV
jgi:hypothetical protein